MKTHLLATVAVLALAVPASIPQASAACVPPQAVCDAVDAALAQLADSIGPLGPGGIAVDPSNLTSSPTFLCSQEYDHGVLRTAECPPDLCGLNIGVVAVEAQGVPNGVAPIGRLDCHDAGHSVTGTIATAPGAFDGNGDFTGAVADRIVGGTHPHCYLDSIGDADYAFVQCGKV